MTHQSAAPAKTAFEADLERLIVEETERMLNRISFLASGYDVEPDAIEKAINRFGGGDLADCWADFASEED